MVSDQGGPGVVLLGAVGGEGGVGRGAPAAHGGHVRRVPEATIQTHRHVPQRSLLAMGGAHPLNLTPSTFSQPPKIATQISKHIQCCIVFIYD